MKIELLNKISTVLEKLDQKTRYCIFAGIAAVIFIFSYFIFTRPQLADLATMAPKIKAVSANLVNAEDEIKMKEGYDEQLQELREKVKLANQSIVSREDVPLLLSRFSRVANENKIKVSQMISNPQWQRLLLEKGDYKYFSFPVQFEAKGSYHDFGRFLNAIERMDIFLVVRGCTISVSKDDVKLHDITPSKDDAKLHDISLILDSIIFEVQPTPVKK